MKEISAIISELTALLPGVNVSDKPADVFVYSRDCWPKTLLWTAQGLAPFKPWCVVFPNSVEEVAKTLKYANDNEIPVIPYGGGSGVCGGVTPIKGGITIDLKNLKKVEKIDKDSMIVKVQSGILGSHLEEKLNAKGFTLGHFPSSIMCSTLGGWVAARSAGQCSSKYGKIEDMVTGLEIALPTGEIITIEPPIPQNASFDLSSVFTGSEGTLAIITAAWLKIHPMPAKRQFMGVNFPSVKEGLEAMRQIMQAGLAPAVLRLYDPLDTLINKTHSAKDEKSLSRLELHNPELASLVMDEAMGELKRSMFRESLKRPKLLNSLTYKLPVGALLVTIFEGEELIADAAFEEAKKIFEANKGQLLGSEPAQYWLKHRYSISFKQMEVFRSGAFVDTMEVCAPWENVQCVYDAVRKALYSQAFVMAHFSHAYPEGCAVYFTLSSASSGDSKELIKKYDETWTIALRAVNEAGGALSHHHGVGLNKSSFMISEHGSLLSTYRNIKETIDPKGIMNPGKMGL